ncbi:hypothetical protein BV22DRAFT_1052301 [Leucogyrophana mollusca]|uniref:Uncharacterized protein n=1 Tax=Leucogyrophana mollusca TaxID=85980 RepID=A0ACB8AX65_9AGAM|nr:hypothetical protein BV22DRAFT_1052301 [Leucogyrophana mollusca]
MPALGAPHEEFCTVMVATVNAMCKATKAALLAPANTDVLDCLCTATAAISEHLDASWDVPLAAQFPELMPATLAALEAAPSSGPMDVDGSVPVEEVEPQSAPTAEAPTAGSAGGSLAALAPSPTHTTSASAGSVEEVVATLSVVVPSTPAALPPSLTSATSATPLSLTTAPPASPALSTAPIATLPVASAQLPPVPQLALPQFPPAPDAPPVTKQGHYKFRLVDGVPIYNIPSFRGNNHIILGYGPGGVNNPVYQTRVDKGNFLAPATTVLKARSPTSASVVNPTASAIDAASTTSRAVPGLLRNLSPTGVPNLPSSLGPLRPTIPKSPQLRSPRRQPFPRLPPSRRVLRGAKSPSKRSLDPRRPRSRREKARLSPPPASRRVHARKLGLPRPLPASLCLPPALFEAGTAPVPIDDSDDDSVEYLGERAADEESVEETSTRSRKLSRTRPPPPPLPASVAVEFVSRYC